MIDGRELHNFQYLHEYDLQDGYDTEIVIEIDGEFFEVDSLAVKDGRLILITGEQI